MPETDISAKQVMELRKLTGAGMMDCKQALKETQGDLEKAQDWLRTHGIAKAGNKADRATNEGMIATYAHSAGGAPVRVAAMVELNCESDFVAKTEAFKELGRELAIQVAGAAPEFVRREEVPAELVERESSIARQKAVAEGKPERVLEQIVTGSLEAFYARVCLVDQPYVRDQKGKKKISELIKETVAKLGENITVARFSRFQVGDAASKGDR